MAHKCGWLVLVTVFTLPTTSLAQEPTNPRVAILADSLEVAMTNAERSATSAGYPRLNILAAVSRSMWETFYHGDYTSAEEADAVARVATDAATPAQKEAAMRMKYELDLN